MYTPQWCTNTLLMITVISNKIKTLNQISYNNLINSLDFNQITCTCGHSGALIKHGYYNRNLKTSGGVMVTIFILRVKCSVCGKTHAILPYSIVPYSQVSLDDHINIILNDINHNSQNDIMNDNPLIDECTISYILRCYKGFWKQRLASHRIALVRNFMQLTDTCLKLFERQFMQIKCTPNILFSCTHIT